VAATVTKSLKLATGICLLPERHALMTAKVIATLDLYSGGRVILGVGAGWLQEETEAMGANFRLRWKLLRETTEAMRICWTQPEPSYHGEMVRFPPVYCEPKPVQKAGPPIFLGGHVPKALERCFDSATDTTTPSTNGKSFSGLALSGLPLSRAREHGSCRSD
jgi:alkanesulfonate monooxygenase SsuD/methylene tetrahydromethanopterin reductase-like flavin-dependent oxidoreductase (luciferase family)